MADNTPTVSKIRIVISAIDDGWIMGEKLTLYTYPDITLANLAHFIFEHKEKEGTTISTSQMKFCLPPNRLLPRDQWGKSLRTCGVLDNTILQLAPIIPSCWLWHPMMFYHDRFRDTIIKVISLYESDNDKDGIGDIDDNMITIEELEKRVPLPPPLQPFGYLTFVRIYPELFYVEVSKGGYEVQVQINRDASLPVWL